MYCHLALMTILESGYHLILLLLKQLKLGSRWQSGKRFNPTCQISKCPPSSYHPFIRRTYWQSRFSPAVKTTHTQSPGPFLILSPTHFWSNLWFSNNTLLWAPAILCSFSGTFFCCFQNRKQCSSFSSSITSSRKPGQPPLQHYTYSFIWGRPCLPTMLCVTFLKALS